MTRVCPTCEREFHTDEIFNVEGFEFTFGVGISYKGQFLKIARGEQLILRLLCSRRFISTQALIDAVCREETLQAKGSIKVRISHLRKHLRLIDAPLTIVTSPGMGYTLVRHVT
jgi:DNA-binding winged helix-turn-helix (wHTH) protein